MFNALFDSWILKVISVNLKMAYFLDLSHFLMAKTEINLRKVTGKRQRGRTEKSELIPFLRLNPVLFTTRDEKKYDLDYDLVKDIQAFIPM